MSSKADPVTDRQRVFRVVGDSMSVITDALGLLEPADRIVLIGSCRDTLDAAEATVVSEQLNNGSSDRQVEKLLGGNDKSTKKTVKTRARRGRAVNKNPDIATRMKNGDLSGEQADVIATAAEKTDGEAAEDEEFIERIASAPPDQGRKIAEDYVRERTDQADVDGAYRRARRNRCVRRWENDRRGTHVLSIEGACDDIDDIESRINILADRMYREDGGRDVPRDKHARTRDQRSFDAALALICSQGPRDGEAETDDSATVVGSDRQATIFVAATVDQIGGFDPSPLSKIGGRTLPIPVIERLACNGEFVGQIYSQVGELLWQGRAIPYPTPAQVRALIARDRQCVLCGATHTRCHAHHLIPRRAPARGPTDVENLALLCGDCHRWVHDQNLTLFFDPSTSTWRSRPATPDEIAPRRPEDRKRDHPNQNPAAEQAPDADWRPGRRRSGRRPRAPSSGAEPAGQAADTTGRKTECGSL